MKRLFAIAVFIALTCPALAYWQSRDSGYNVSVGVTAPSYTYISFVESSASGANISQSFALGTNGACRGVVGFIGTGTSDHVSAVSLAGVSLSEDTTQIDVGGGIFADIWSGNLTSGQCTGSQTLSVTSSSTSFSYRAAAVYVVFNLVTNGHVQVGGYNVNGGVKTPTSPTISVTAHDLMFAVIASLGDASISTCSSSTQTPNHTNAFATKVYDGMADWVISSTNASFAINCDAASNDRVVPVATFH